MFWPGRKRKLFTRDSWDWAFLKMDQAWYISLFLLPEWVSVPGCRPFLDEGEDKTTEWERGMGMGEGGRKNEG